MAKKKSDPYATQAQADALVRYGPEYSALTALLRDAEDRRDTNLRQAKATRQSTVASVNAAIPQAAQAYQGAQQAVTPAFAGGGGIEASALTARLGEAQAQAQTQLVARRTGAVEGEGAARSAALRDYASDRAKVGQRALDLGNEQGAFITGEIGDLSSAAAKAEQQAASQQASLGQSERNSVRSSGIDPDTGLPIPGGRLDPSTKGKPNNGAGWLSTTKQGAIADEVSETQGWAEKLKQAGVSRDDVQAALTVGAKPEPVYREVVTKDPVTGKVKSTKQEKVLWQSGEPGNEDGSLTGTQKTTDELPKAKSKLLLQAALEQAYDGHLSVDTQRKLHARGIRLDVLGLTTLGDWRKKQRQQAGQRQIITRPANAPDSNGQYRPT